MHSHNPPAVTSSKPASGIAGSTTTAPGHEVTPCAMAMIASMPHPIGCRPQACSPNGISAQVTIAHGITQNPVIGTATILAATE